jgi:hypothetical protein
MLKKFTVPLLEAIQPDELLLKKKLAIPEFNEEVMPNDVLHSSYGRTAPHHDSPHNELLAKVANTSSNSCLFHVSPPYKGNRQGIHREVE